MRKSTFVLVILSALLGGCFVPVPGPPGRSGHYHHHDWR
jgi:hypothetical protein